MGFFSWRTSDTNEPIWNRYSEAGKCKVVYLLQPGDDNICETYYEGYGVFGGMDAYVWLAMHNLSKDELKKIMKGNECMIPDDEAEQTLRSRGISMELSNYFVDKDDGSKWGFVSSDNPYGIQPFFNPDTDFDTQIKKAKEMVKSPEKLDLKQEEALEKTVRTYLDTLKGYSGRYDSPQKKYDGKTPNELIKSGQWETRKMAELMLPEGKQYLPLKFSFNKDAKYEDLPAAKNHQGQGFWTDDEQEEVIEELCAQ